MSWPMMGRRTTGALVGAALVLATGPVRAEEKEHCHSSAGAATDAPASTSARATMAYTAPDMRLVRADGTEVIIRTELERSGPVVLNFIFTTCTTICPVLSQTLARVQEKLGPDRDRVRMISVSIDPERDTPARLSEYARKFKAGPEWGFYTGTAEASVAMQKAFDVFRGNKMNHVPVTFVRTAPDHPWIRLEGLGNTEAILREIRPALALNDSRRP
jgi:protein SCO1/2